MEKKKNLWTRIQVWVKRDQFEGYKFFWLSGEPVGMGVKPKFQISKLGTLNMPAIGCFGPIENYSPGTRNQLKSQTKKPIKGF